MRWLIQPPPPPPPYTHGYRWRQLAAFSSTSSQTGHVRSARADLDALGKKYELFADPDGPGAQINDPRAPKESQELFVNVKYDADVVTTGESKVFMGAKIVALWSIKGGEQLLILYGLGCG